MSVFLIAEIGVNHNGYVDAAIQLIDAAVDAGADAVKFQAFTAERLDPPGDRQEMLKCFELSEGKLLELCSYAASRCIEFMVTPFDVDWLYASVELLKVKRIKLASGAITNDELILAADESGLPVLLSTGMATLDEIRHAMAMMCGDVELMHCVSAYPTMPYELNLQRITRLQSEFGCHVGLSDHSLSIYPSIAAVGMGVTSIERHLTLDQRWNGPDHAASLTPKEFGAFVAAVREVEQAMNYSPQPLQSEGRALAIRNERDAWRRMTERP